VLIDFVIPFEMHGMNNVKGMAVCCENYTTAYTVWLKEKRATDQSTRDSD
jgi:hypothetical protein